MKTIDDLLLHVINKEASPIEKQSKFIPEEELKLIWDGFVTTGKRDFVMYTSEAGHAAFEKVLDDISKEVK